MAVNQIERRNLAILLKMIDDEPLMVQYLNDSNLLNFIKLDLYDGTKLRLTPKGQKFVDNALKNEEPRYFEDSLVGWSGELGSNPRRAGSSSAARSRPGGALRPGKKLSRQMSKRVSLKIKKLVREGYPVKQAAAIAYGYARKGKIGKRGGIKRNPVTDKKLKSYEAELKKINNALERLDQEGYPTYGDKWQDLSERRRELKDLINKSRKNPIGVVTKRWNEWGVIYEDPKRPRSARKPWHMLADKYKHLGPTLKGKAVPFEIDENDDAHLTFEKGLA